MRRLRYSTNVSGYLAEITAPRKTKQAGIATLLGVGRRFFDLAPENFKTVLWELIDAGAPLHSIAVISSGPHIPWELMVPARVLADGRRENRSPLGVEFAIGRWTGWSKPSRPQVIPLHDSYVIAPNYDAYLRLHYAREEADFVISHFNGTIIFPADHSSIAHKLGSEPRSLLHIVAHGGVRDNREPTIFLDNEEKLSPVDLLGMSGVEESFLRKRPFVFLNVSEIGRLQPITAGSGFVESFVDIGVSALVAPVWSVKDDIAHEVATEFYAMITKDPDTPFAEALRRIRSRAYDISTGEDSYTAYCLYGDPLARATYQLSGSE